MLTVWRLKKLCTFLCIGFAFSTFLSSVCRKILVAVLIPFSYLCFRTIVSIFVHTASRETGFFLEFSERLDCRSFSFPPLLRLIILHFGQSVSHTSDFSRFTVEAYSICLPGFLVGEAYNAYNAWAGILNYYNK